MSWGSAPDLEDGLDEAALKARFVELCAKYPDQPPIEVGRFVYQEAGGEDLFRGERLGLAWSNSLEVREAVREAMLGKVPGEVPSKDELVKETLAIARNDKVADKERVAAYALAGKLLGYVTEKPAAPVTPAFPAVNFKRYDKPAEAG